MAAPRASGAEEKAQQKASPTVLKTCPSRSSMAERRIPSWRARADCIADASRSQRRGGASFFGGKEGPPPPGGEGSRKEGGGGKGGEFGGGGYFKKKKINRLILT